LKAATSSIQKQISAVRDVAVANEGWRGRGEHHPPKLEGR